MQTFVLFGASGDLAKEKLYPALFDLFLAGEKLRCIGFARTLIESDAFHMLVRASVLKQKPDAESTALESFLKYFSYVNGSYDTDGIASLKRHLSERASGSEEETKHGLSFYLAIPVEYDIIESIVTGLSSNGIINERSAIAIEKPFGLDGASASRLNALLDSYFSEEQIYRIDHYLAKGMVQDLFAFRFANPIFEPIWNNQYIEEIRVVIAEDSGIRKRGQYYERAGVIRDMLQNHALQLLAFTTMDQPENLKAASIHREKIRILRELRLFENSGLDAIEIGQYRGYREEAFVDPHSLVETSGTLRLEIDNAKWRGVPLIITSGKKMKRRSTDITILFKKKTCCLWDDTDCELQQNSLHINIQPDNDIRLRLNSEFNPEQKCAYPVDLRFGFLDNEYLFKDSYENALRDFFHRDQGIFLNAEEISLSWKLIDGALDLIRPVREEILKIY